MPETHEAIHSLASRDDDAALDALRELCSASDPFLRRTALEVIGRNPRGRELIASVLAAFRDPSEYVRRTACDVAAHWKLSEAHDLLLLLLKEPTSSTRDSALRALSVIWDDADFQTVLQYTDGIPNSLFGCKLPRPCDRNFSVTVGVCFSMIFATINFRGIAHGRAN